MSSGEDNPDQSDIMRILIVSDTHIGYMERDPVRGGDSFRTWEEVLKLAYDREVDFILHGGDLFHSNKPSQKTIYKTMKSIRQYCFGNKPIDITIHSDQSKNFPNFNTVNYEDPNFNIAIPIFVIHGNHDDPTGDASLSALDILGISNFVNYFGKCTKVDDIDIYPILMSKGYTKLALYGLGNIRDERLSRTFEKGKVKFLQPVSDQEWFNLFVLHQNRVRRTQKGSIYEGHIGEFMDFVLWGHEHECKIEYEKSEVGGFSISQPGSTIATSLSPGEAAPEKHVAILEICEKKFRMEYIPLKTVRPFVIDDIILSEQNLDSDDPDSVPEFLASKVEEMIQKAINNYTGSLQPMPLPLIRLRVEYTGFSSIHPSRFGQRFVQRVANPEEILNFHRKKKMNDLPSLPKQNNGDGMDLEIPPAMNKDQINELIATFLSENIGSLSALPQSYLNDALSNYVNKEEDKALSSFIKDSISKTQDYLITNMKDQASSNEIEEKIKEHTSRLESDYQMVLSQTQDPLTQFSQTDGKEKKKRRKKKKGEDGTISAKKSRSKKVVPKVEVKREVTEDSDDIIIIEDVKKPSSKSSRRDMLSSLFSGASSVKKEVKVKDEPGKPRKRKIGALDNLLPVSTKKKVKHTTLNSQTDNEMDDDLFDASSWAT
eukprot:TRINITY_DN1916_c0_g1_i1.p1 TRINITY_DN1916_c0_g1~~TRINITY_DN1916_c0_g1_i1.p1  ORF type:complete len:658 (+),score=153.95 TRINITY_DN1916_c0_g1_i1:29-2002(+)